MGERLEFMSEVYNRTKSNIMVWSYRGYGYSEGSPSEDGIKLDIQAIFRYITHCEEIDKDRIFIFGTSFGGAVTFYGTSLGLKKKQFEPRGLIIENTFTSMDDMLKRKMGAFVAGLISKNHWRTIDVIDRISTPMMFITGLKDAMIPKEFGNKVLAEKATSTKFKVMNDFPDGEHKDIWLFEKEKYFGLINEFMQKCL